MKHILLILTPILIVSTLSFGTNYYSIAGGNWSTVSHSGADCGCTPPVNFPVGDTIFVDRSTCDIDPDNMTRLIGTIPNVTQLTNCHQLGFSNLFGTISIDNGFLYISSTTTIENGGRVFMKGNSELSINGSWNFATGDGSIELDDTGQSEIRFFGTFTLNTGTSITGAGDIICFGQNVLQPGAQIFTEVGPQTIACGSAVLPVQLDQFDIEENTLTWTTTLEINNSHFIIEKSTDNVDFEELARIESAAPNGTSNEPITYQFVDDRYEEFGHYVYRIKQVDIDGKVTYYYANDLHKVEEDEISLYPNPSNGDFTITTNHGEGISKVEVYSTTGTLIKEIEVENEQQVIIDENLEQGSYIIRIYDTNFHVSHKKLKVF